MGRPLPYAGQRVGQSHLHGAAQQEGPVAVEVPAGAAPGHILRIAEAGILDRTSGLRGEQRVVLATAPATAGAGAACDG